MLPTQSKKQESKCYYQHNEKNKKTSAITMKNEET